MSKELSDPATLRLHAGKYETPTGATFEVVLKEDGGTFLTRSAIRTLLSSSGLEAIAMQEGYRA